MGLGVGAQHTQCLEAWFAHIPGLRVVVPGTPADAKGLLKTAIRSQDPVIFLEYKKLYPVKGPVSSDPDLLIPFGKARIHREGSDVTICATGHMVMKAIEAAERLAEQGISAEVVDPRTVSPLDFDTILASVEKTSRLVVCDEATITCSIASEIAATVSDRGFYFLDAPRPPGLLAGGAEAVQPLAGALFGAPDRGYLRGGDRPRELSPPRP